MALQQQSRPSSPVRWTKAAQRARAEGIEVRQIDATGQWVATSGTAAHAAYELEVTGSICHGCSCLAGINNDPVCKHRAMWYVLLGALDPEPTLPTPAVRCWRCFGDGECWVNGEYVACPLCGGNGRLPAPIAA